MVSDLRSASDASLQTVILMVHRFRFDFCCCQSPFVLYRNDLFDHTIQIYENDAFKEANGEWLLTFWSDWFKELATVDYDHLELAQQLASWSSLTFLKSKPISSDELIGFLFQSIKSSSR